MLPSRYRLMLILFLLPVLLLSCTLGQKTPSRESRVIVSQEAADNLEQKLKDSIQSQDGGSFDLEITEEELTSFVVLGITDRIDRPEEMPLEDFQARFVDGQIDLSGKLTTVCPFSLNVRVAAAAQVKDGQLSVNVSRARVGAIPLPKGLLKNLSRIVSESIIESPEHLERSVEVTAVEIGDGVMRISGRVLQNGG